MRNTNYSIQLGKGCGLVDETLSLLSICNVDTTKESLAAYVHDNNYLARCTDRRSMDIVKLVFWPRFMKSNKNVALWLRAIRGKGLMLPQFKQLLMIYCARENAVMYDFIVQYLNEYKATNKTTLPAGCIKQFVDDLVDKGLAKWSDSVKTRNSSYIKAVLVDFDFVNRRGDILPYEVADFTILYLMHELHFEGLSDVAVWNHEDWQLFGLDKYQVGERIMELNLKGGYIAQCTGDLMTISWKYNSMEEFINGTL